MAAVLQDAPVAEQLWADIGIEADPGALGVVALHGLEDLGSKGIVGHQGAART